MAADTLGVFPLFPKRTAGILAPRLSVVFRRFDRQSSFKLARDRPISPQFRNVYLPPLLAITDRTH